MPDARPEAESSPNLLLVYVDQLRFDALGCAGNPDVVSPNLDRLAAGGTRFDRCFVQNPVCMPSRVSLLTSRYPSALGIVEMGVRVPGDLLTLPRMLRNHGYHSANLGKLHFLPHANRDHRRVHPDYGFDQLEISDEPGPYDDAYAAWVRRHHPDSLPAVRAVAMPPMARAYREAMGLPIDPDAMPADVDPMAPRAFGGDGRATHAAWVADRTLGYLDARAADGRPFCCVAGFYSPHPPLVAPQRYLDLYDPAALTLPDRPAWATTPEAALRAARHGYYAMVSELDAHVGRFLDRLDATGLAGRTVVAFTSDHGEFLGEHDRWGKAHPAPDSVSRVPLIVRAPGGAGRAGRVEGGIVEAVDVVPTLLELAGVPVPPQVQGRSLAAAVLGRPFAGRDGALLEGDGYRAYRADAHRYLLHADGRELLYDLADPLGEWRDVAGDPARAATLADLRRRLACRMIAATAKLERTWPY